MIKRVKAEIWFWLEKRRITKLACFETRQGRRKYERDVAKAWKRKTKLAVS